MGYADQLYALHLELARKSEALGREIDESFQEISTEETRLAGVRAARDAGQFAREETIEKERSQPLKPSAPSMWDDEDSFWEFRNTRSKY